MNSIKNVPKSGLHNPFKNPERYLMLGDVCFRTEIQENKVKFLFSKNYYYVPSDIYLVELNEYRKLKNIHLMDGKDWFFM
jgi:hypothetical protein